MIYADIIIDISVEKLDKSFQYRVPGELQDKVYPGAVCLIPFGKGGRTIRGYVISLSEKPVIDESKIRDISEVVSVSGKPGGEEQLLKLAFWIKKHYGGTLSQALKVVFPVKKSVRERKISVIYPLLSPEELVKAAEEFGRKHNRARERTLRAIADTGEIEASLLINKLNISKDVLRGLSERGFIRIEESREYRSPDIRKESSMTRGELSAEQQNVLSSFIKDYDAGLKETYLIRGVTGSGKTLVYIDMIEHVVNSGRQAIMLIPEIALTFQTVMRFHARFGDRVSYMHSRLSPGERYDQFERARSGEIDVMIGPRSALFTPFNDLGVIIIDEEHENSYKADNMPKYHIRETAEKRASIAGASLVLGSATPSVEAEYRARRGEYRLFTMNSRPTGGDLPKVSVVDLREELKRGNRSMFSIRLQDLMRDRLEKNEQIMLFLNRRGYSGFVNCRKCGHVVKCPHCDVSLTSHKDGFLTCHYCGYRTKMVKTCPECGSRYIGGMRAGTEQVEENVKKLFPGAGILRMDGDTTRRKGDYDNILSAFKDRKADILIGTQMIVKGHDFPNVTLVGIIAADLSLNASDFRSAERTFDLITQAAGRAGRGEKEGEVVIQTYSPEHYSIEAAAHQDYNRFYSHEIMYRELCGYPPVSHLLKVLIEGENEDIVKKEAETLKKTAGSIPDKDIRILGPAPDVIGKLKDVFRYALYVRHDDYEILTTVMESMEDSRRRDSRYSTTVTFDFDPQ